VSKVDPRLMVQHLNQQTFPNRDTLRIVHSRHDHLQWMHDHWANGVLSGADVLAQIDDAAPSTTGAETDAEVPAALSDAAEPPLDTDTWRHG
jgi:hypothetical protein